jgi:hypothetical protein
VNKPRKTGFLGTAAPTLHQHFQGEPTLPTSPRWFVCPWTVQELLAVGVDPDCPSREQFCPLFSLLMVQPATHVTSPSRVQLQPTIPPARHLDHLQVIQNVRASRMSHGHYQSHVPRSLPVACPKVITDVLWSLPNQGATSYLSHGQ